MSHYSRLSHSLLTPWPRVGTIILLDFSGVDLMAMVAVLVKVVVEDKVVALMATGAVNRHLD